MILKAIKERYLKSVSHRCEEQEYLKYFSYNDFQKLNHKPYSFKSLNDNTLRGNFYYYDGYDDSKLVIFCHGMGAGHRSYMKEIEMLCKNKFIVLAYDNTGCVDSDGDNINALSQSLADLDYAIKSLANSEFKEKDIYVVGHSWGAYATLNILKYSSQVKKICAMAGFLSVKRQFKNELTGIKRIFLPYLFSLEYKRSHYAKADAFNTLKNTDCKCLLIHSMDDTSVSYKNNTLYLQNNITNPNIEYLILNNKVHNPNYTEDAVKYFNLTFSKFQDLLKKGKLKELSEKIDFFKDVDFDKMTEQDPKVWDKIISFLR